MDIEKELVAYKKYRKLELNTFGLQLGDFKNLAEYLGALTWLSAKADAVNQPDQMTISFDRFEELISKAVGVVSKNESIAPGWIDYTKQSPRIDGRYQIFISGEQLAADYKHPFGFSCPIDGCALIQKLITHWAVLGDDPVGAQEQGHD